MLLACFVVTCSVFSEEHRPDAAPAPAADQGHSLSEAAEIEQLMGEMTELYQALENVSTGALVKGISAGTTDRILAELLSESQEPSLSAADTHASAAVERALGRARQWGLAAAVGIMCLVAGVLIARSVIAVAVAVDAADIRRRSGGGILMPPWLWAACVLLGGIAAARLYWHVRSNQGSNTGNRPGGRES